MGLDTADICRYHTLLERSLESRVSCSALSSRHELTPYHTHHVGGGGEHRVWECESACGGGKCTTISPKIASATQPPLMCAYGSRVIGDSKPVLYCTTVLRCLFFTQTQRDQNPHTKWALFCTLRFTFLSAYTIAYLTVKVFLSARDHRDSENTVTVK